MPVHLIYELSCDMCEYIAYCEWVWWHAYTNRCENTMTCMNEIIITHRGRLITDDSILTVDTVWESHSGKSTTGRGEYWDTRHNDPCRWLLNHF